MFLNIGKRLWLAALALWPVVGWGQPRIIQHPQNATVCVGEVATFTSETNSGFAGWYINGTVLEDFSPGGVDIEVMHSQDSTTIQTVTVTYNQIFNGLSVQLSLAVVGASPIDSPTVYLFYKSSQQFPVSGLNVVAINTTAYINWNAHSSNLTTEYLLGVYDRNNNPITNQTTNITYASFELPPRVDGTCQLLKLRVTANQCPKSNNSGFIQNEATTFTYREPDIDLVPAVAAIARFISNQGALASWTLDSGSAFQIVLTDLESGGQSIFNSTSPISYAPPLCDQPVDLNIAISPILCPDDPDFTHSDSISFTIPCPTTATEATEPETDVSGEHSGTQALYPSVLIIAAIIPMLKWQH